MNRILIVDDNRQLLEQLKALLSGFGYDVAFIARADFLFARLERGTFDLILLDINMPGMSGMELLEQLKADERYRDIPVIMITGEDNETLLARCFELGAADYINKPVSELILKARVGAALTAQRYVRELLEQQEAIQAQEVELERQKTVQYRLSSLSAQMNPHFIFNSLNSIQFFLLDNKIEGAMEYISDFSRLMRLALEQSRQRYIAVSEEIEFLELYMGVEAERFERKFEFRVDVEEEMDTENLFLPPMLVQPYVENAILHGLAHKTGKGNLLVRFEEEEGALVCTVEDDGVGRKRVQEIQEMGTRKKHRSLAMRIAQTRLELLNSLEDESFEVVVEDLYDHQGIAAGTRVRLTMPDDLEG